MTVENIIKKLNLAVHPEGGFFTEVTKSDEKISPQCLPERYESGRSFYTSIYYLLRNGEKSHFHKINSDEIWYFHLGSSVIIHMLSESGGYSQITLGNEILKDEKPQFTIQRGVWFAAELVNPESFGLFSCNVAPGFEFADFELAKRDYLKTQFPEHENLITRLTMK